VLQQYDVRGESRRTVFFLSGGNHDSLLHY
jgi:hypothetical protein